MNKNCCVVSWIISLKITLPSQKHRSSKIAYYPCPGPSRRSVNRKWRLIGQSGTNECADGVTKAPFFSLSFSISVAEFNGILTLRHWLHTDRTWATICSNCGELRAVRLWPHIKSYIKPNVTDILVSLDLQWFTEKRDWLPRLFM